ncbi:hypothetical protein LTSEMIN_1040 [Salmonella enterica subsp. enterica serovar Minnesota str. A4-603]|nr:hypothetical protein LTSEMIN_1040 [Salmonella enterica subsp. enterica serovar Minnesota str. A4-603]
MTRRFQRVPCLMTRRFRFQAYGSNNIVGLISETPSGKT